MKKSYILVGILIVLLMLYLFYPKTKFTLKRDGLTVSFFKDGKKVATQTLDENGNVKSTDGSVPDGKIVEYQVRVYEYKGGFKEGVTKIYNESDKLYGQIMYSKDKPHGMTKFFFDNGSPQTEYFYQNGVLDGDAKIFYKNGKVQAEGQYKNGNLNGTYKMYFTSGKLALIDNYADGKIIGRKVCDSDGVQMKEKIVPLYKGKAIEALPQLVSEYGRGKFLSLSKLTLSKGGLSGSFQLNSEVDMNSNFILVVYIETSNQVLVAYKDEQRELLAVSSFRTGGVTPLFSINGYKIKGSGEENTIEFSIPERSGVTYDLGGSSMTITIFCLEGSVNSNYLPQGENGVFSSISNVLTATR